MMSDKRSVTDAESESLALKEALDMTVAENQELRLRLKQKTQEADYSASLLQMLSPDDEKSLARYKYLEHSVSEWERKYNEKEQEVRRLQQTIAEVRSLVALGFDDL